MGLQFGLRRTQESISSQVHPDEICKQNEACPVIPQLAGQLIIRCCEFYESRTLHGRELCQQYGLAWAAYRSCWRDTRTWIGSRSLTPCSSVMIIWAYCHLLCQLCKCFYLGKGSPSPYLFTPCRKVFAYVLAQPMWAGSITNCSIYGRENLSVTMIPCWWGGGAYCLSLKVDEHCTISGQNQLSEILCDI